MKFIALGVISIVLLLLAVIVFQNQQHTVPMTKPPNTHTQTMKAIGWIPNWDQDAAVASYKAHIDKLPYVSVFWYQVNANGELTTYQETREDMGLISYVHENHKKIFALVANLPDFPEGKDWDSDRVQKVISSKEARQKHIADIVGLVTSKNFDGVDIDYEALKTSQKQDFTLFIQELSSAMRKKHKLVGVAIYPPSNEPNQDYGAAAQDVPQIAKSADQLYFMTYLERTLSSEPGPTGSLPWVEESVTYAINTLHVPKEKIFMGIGLMGTAWRQNPDGSTVGDQDDLTYQEVQGFIQSTTKTPSWDSASQSPSFMFTDENGTHIIWYEDGDSAAKKIDLAKSLSVGGIAFWRLGNEDEAVWKYVK